MRKGRRRKRREKRRKGKRRSGKKRKRKENEEKNNPTYYRCRLESQKKKKNNGSWGYEVSHRQFKVSPVNRDQGRNHKEDTG